MKLVQLTVRYASGGSDVSDTNAMTSNATRPRMYSIDSEMYTTNNTRPNSHFTKLESFFGQSSMLKPNQYIAKRNAGTHVIAKEDIRHSNCSVGVGNSNDHAMQ